MTKKLELTLLLLFGVSIITKSQTIKEISIDKTSSPDKYYVVEPKDSIKGVLLLLPGSYQEAESIFPETKLHNVAYVNKILVVTFTCDKTKAYIDESIIFKINRVLTDVIVKYKIPRDKFVIGGYSAGGMISLSFVEYCKQYPEKAVINPQAVFTVDSPVDLIDLWYTLNREIEKNFSEAAINEANAFLKTMKEDLKGTPEDNLGNYIKHSPYYHGIKDGGNVKFLNDIPVRLYHDPDILWQLKNRRRDFFDMNELCASAMINKLLLMGNDKAEFMISDRPGYRSNGYRHPHSWSIVEEVECIQWIRKCLRIK
jgi:hypothetical protein